MQLEFTKFSESKPPTGCTILIRNGKNFATGYVGYYGVEPTCVYSTYDGAGSVAFDFNFNLAEWAILCV